MYQIIAHPELAPASNYDRAGLLDSSINTCTVNTATDLITVAGVHGLAAGDQVRFSTTGTLPAPLAVNSRYYVLTTGLTTTDLKISLTAGGSVIDITSTGTGTHTIWKNSKYSALAGPSGYTNLTFVVDEVYSITSLQDNTFPDGYVGYPYLFEQDFDGSTFFSVVGGTLPPGIALTQPTPDVVRISGTPTTVGTYDFTTELTRGGASSQFECHLTINPDPDEGIGVVGGG